MIKYKLLTYYYYYYYCCCCYYYYYYIYYAKRQHNIQYIHKNTSIIVSYAIIQCYYIIKMW